MGSNADDADAVPWFLVDASVSFETGSEEKEIKQFEKHSRSARLLQKWWTRIGKPRCLKKRQDLSLHAAVDREQTPQGRGRGRGRRGSGGRGMKSSGTRTNFLEKSVNELESLEADVQTIENLYLFAPNPMLAN